VPTLTWMTREEDVRAAAHVPYRLLEAQPDYDGGSADYGNMLIQGDNLDALKALLPYFAGRVRCIYIDPPYTPARRSSITTTTWSTADGWP
jgi:adenine-specific DNA-methyltransferase